MTKLIHQVYGLFNDGISYEDIPKYAENVQATKKFCKIHNIEYKMWGLKDCDKLIESDFPEYMDLWINFRYPIQKADFIRYCILFVYGGLYIDCDIRPVKSLDFIFDQPYYFVHWSNDHKKLPYNAVMGSHAGRPLFLYIMNECERSVKEKNKIESYNTWKGRYIFHTTGHFMLERAMKENNIDKSKYFHDSIYIHNPDKKGMGAIGNMNNAFFFDSNASIWYDEWFNNNP